jgi:Protein of unknown function (DUF3455)
MLVRNKLKLSLTSAALVIGGIGISSVALVTPSSAQTASAQGPFSFPFPSGFPRFGGLDASAQASAASMAAIAVPGTQIEVVVPANGTQDYVCRTNSNGVAAWAFTGPRANLYSHVNQAPFNLQKYGTHFNLQGTPQAGTSADGPRWRSFDGTQLRGRVMASAPGRTSGDIPVLLLRAEFESFAALGSDFGRNGVPTTKPTWSTITHIQRVNTRGGVAPANGCTASTLGSIAQVPYSTTYLLLGPVPPPVPDYGVCDEFGNYCPA